ncbi:hypothetical protein D3C73_1611570 [compost metagenome]
MAGDHQHAIANIAIDIHLLIHEDHAFIVEQIDFVEYDNGLNLQRFAGNQISVDNIE